MASLKERVTAAIARLRDRYAWFDHTLRMVKHYGSVNGNGQAGAVTYFGFLSFFPILALGFFVVGLVAHLYPDIKGQMVTEINSLLPGVIGPKKGQIPLTTIEDYSGTIGLVGLVAVVYSGLGWLSGMRQALEVMFAVPRREQPNLLLGKARDLGTLALIGLTLMLSVTLSGAVTGFSGAILGLVGIDSASTVPTLVLGLVGHALAIVASAVLLMTMFKLLLVESHVPRGALVRGALLGAVGFEILKLAANLLLKQTQGNPAFQAFGVALILLIWINYFSRLVMYSAAWSYTATSALEQRTVEARRAPGAALTTDEPDAAERPVAQPQPAAVAVTGPATEAHRSEAGTSPWRPVALVGGAALIGAVVVRGLKGHR
ncbi:MAG: YhjD/YihY/BrkB family envelope integrity protein [Nocardioidaceae bacterium]